MSTFKPLPSDHPWSSSRYHFHKEVMPVLERHAREIGIMARAGDKHAQQVVKYYAMLHASFDPVTSLLLEEELKGMGYKL